MWSPEWRRIEERSSIGLEEVVCFRRQSIFQLVEIDMKKEKKGLNALISRGNHEKTETAQVNVVL